LIQLFKPDDATMSTHQEWRDALVRLELETLSIAAGSVALTWGRSRGAPSAGRRGKVAFAATGLETPAPIPAGPPTDEARSVLSGGR
jgi:hypothetical protein